MRANITGGMHDFNVQCLELARSKLAEASGSDKSAPSRDDLVAMFVALPSMPEDTKQEYVVGAAMVRCVQEMMQACYGMMLWRVCKGMGQPVVCTLTLCFWFAPSAHHPTSCLLAHVLALAGPEDG